MIFFKRKKKIEEQLSEINLTLKELAKGYQMLADKIYWEDKKPKKVKKK